MKTSLGRLVVVSTAAALVVAPITLAGAAAAPKVGATCAKVGATAASGTQSLICQLKGRKRAWAVAPAASTVPATTKTASTGGAVTTASTATTTAAAVGLPKSPGFDPATNTISVGYLGNVAGGPFAPGGKALFAGFDSYIQRVNAAGGVNGKYKINNIFLETAYDPNQAVAKYNEAKDSVVFFSNVFGTPIVTALLPQLVKDDLVGVPTSLDAEWVNKPNFLANGGSYQAQAMNGVEYYLSTAGANKKVCGLTVQTSFGLTGQEGYRYAVATKKLSAGPDLVVAASDTNMTAPMSQFKAAGCDAIVMTTLPAQTTSALVTGDQNGYNPTLLCVSPCFDLNAMTPQNSPLYSKQLLYFGDPAPWGDTSNPGMKDMLDDLAKYNPYYIGNPNVAAVWGYAQARLVEALIKKAIANNDLSKAGIKKAVATLGRVDLGGAFPEYDYGDPTKRQVTPFVNVYRPDASVLAGLVLVKGAYASDLAKGYRK